MLPSSPFTLRAARVNTGPSPQPDIAVMVLMNLRRGGLLWGWARFLWGRYTLFRMQGLRFAKVLGSGFEGGFGLKPSLTRQGLFCVFQGEAAADAFLRSPWLQAAQPHLQEWCWLKLQPFSSRGSWSSEVITCSVSEPDQGPVASLTRASIRWSRLRPFWRHAPPAEQALASSQGCLLAVGLGEAPVVRQATFSVWQSIDHMNAYARSGAHLQAIQTAYRQQHFSESMFVRYSVLGQGGQWKGVSLG